MSYMQQRSSPFDTGTVRMLFEGVSSDFIFDIRKRRTNMTRTGLNTDVALSFFPLPCHQEKAQIAKDLEEKMRLEREKKAKKQAAREEKERQEAEERRRQEELEIAEQARRLQEEQRVRTQRQFIGQRSSG